MKDEILRRLFVIMEESDRESLQDIYKRLKEPIEYTEESEVKKLLVELYLLSDVTERKQLADQCYSAVGSIACEDIEVIKDVYPFSKLAFKIIRSLLNKVLLTYDVANLMPQEETNTNNNVEQIDLTYVTNMMFDELKNLMKDIEDKIKYLRTEHDYWQFNLYDWRGKEKNIILCINKAGIPTGGVTKRITNERFQYQIHNAFGSSFNSDCEFVWIHNSKAIKIKAINLEQAKSLAVDLAQDESIENDSFMKLEDL